MRNLDRTDEASHLIRLSDRQWAFWRWVGLRSAGFPAVEALKLSSPMAAQAADRLLDAEQFIESSKTELLNRLHAELDALRKHNLPEEKNKRGTLWQILSAVKADKAPDLSHNPGLQREANNLRAAYTRADELKIEFSQAYKASVRNTSIAIREILKSDPFREAILWQNRQAFHRVVDWLLTEQDDDQPRSTRQRKNEEFIASYLQRYCLKNDTIGFFGPVGWAKFNSKETGLSSRPGEKLAVMRKTYFEPWGVEELAKKIASNKALRPWFKPICTPFIHIEKETLHHPLYGEIRMSPVQSSILALCNGELTSEKIAQKLSKSASTGLLNEERIYDLLDQMAHKGMIFLGFNIPLHPFPELVLRQQIEEITEDNLRQEALMALSELERARNVIAASAGDTEKLDRALDHLEQTFTKLTGVAPTRRHGETYASRTLVYEDCCRDIDVEIGEDLVNSLAEPISLLLISGRWFTLEFARLYQRIFMEIYEDMVRDQGSRVVRASQFWLKAIPFVFGERSEIRHPLVEDFRRRWERLLLPGPEERPVQHRAEQLRPQVVTEFEAPKAGWRFAHYHSPDVMLLATDEKEARRGHYQFVLGEFHLGANTLGASAFYHQHPRPQDLVQSARLDIGGRRVVPVALKDHPSMTARTIGTLVQPDDLRLEFSRDVFTPDRSKALPISSLVIENKDGALVARTREGSIQFDLIELFGWRFTTIVCNKFKFFSFRPYTPRISIDRLIVSRETWRPTAVDLEFAYEKDRGKRYLAARRWARANNMPRFVFIKVPIERKPFFVDFDSPIYVELFLKAIRRTVENESAQAGVIVSEMLPNPDQLWLRDRQGQRYTSEFRIVAVDLVDS